MFKKLKNYEMSKRILYVLGYIIAVLFPFVLIVSLVTGDVAPLTRYVEGMFALASVSVGFYYWKAKNENLHKYRDEDSTLYFKQRLDEELAKLKDGD